MEHLLGRWLQTQRRRTPTVGGILNYPLRSCPDRRASGRTHGAFKAGDDSSFRFWSDYFQTMRIKPCFNLTVDWFIFSLFFNFVGGRFIVEGLKRALILADVLLKNWRLCVPPLNFEELASIKLPSIFFFLLSLLPQLWVFDQSGLLLLKIVYALVEVLLLLAVLHLVAEFNFCLLDQADHFLKSFWLLSRSVSQVARESVLTSSVLLTFKLQLVLSSLGYNCILKGSIFGDCYQGFSCRRVVR